jgi:hypothetical protein
MFYDVGVESRYTLYVFEWNEQEENIMMPQQTPYTTPPIEVRPEMPPPVAQRPISPEYNEQFIETLAQRLMPRLMPEIMFNLRSFEPERLRSKAFGMSLALAIVSVVLMIPLVAIILGALGVAATGGGVVPALIGLGIVGLVVLAINVMYNYWLFSAKSTRV